MKKKKIDYNKPVSINKDIWFYANPKSFEFVVWTNFNDKINRQCVQFRLTHRKIKKFL